MNNNENNGFCEWTLNGKKNNKLRNSMPTTENEVFKCGFICYILEHVVDYVSHCVSEIHLKKCGFFMNSPFETGM